MGSSTLAEGGAPTLEELRRMVEDHKRTRPKLTRALRQDAARFAAMRGERHDYPGALRQWLNALRLVWASEDYLGVALYRFRVVLRDAGVPVLPTIIRRMSIAMFSIRIGDGVVIGEGLYLPHGNVVIEGVTEIGRNAVIAPWAVIGCLQGSFIGPNIGNDVFIGTRTSILGAMTIGDGAVVGTGSVVTHDVPAGVTVAGVPARPTRPGVKHEIAN